MLSKLKHFKVEDEAGGRAKFLDLAATLLDTDYPVVSHLFYRVDKKIMRVAWDAVRFIDWENRQIKVSDFGEAKEVTLKPRKDYVLLRNEILDALLLDLQNRRAFRANDLQLEEQDGGLQLRAADASLSAILRRISLGFFNHVSESELYDWKYVEFLRGNPKAVESGAGYHLRITRMPPGEIAQLTYFVPYLHAAELLTLLPDPIAVKTLEVMPVVRQLQVFEELGEEQAARLLTIMAPDAAADLIGRLQTAAMRRYLEIIPPDRSRKIIELLRYPEDAVGGIMTNDIVFLPCDLTVGEARRELRERFSKTDFIYLIYVVDNRQSQTLRGAVSLRRLFVADDGQKLEEIMDPYIATLNCTDPAKEAAYRVVGSQLAAMPVVETDKRLIGAVTIDAAIGEISSTETSETLRIFS